MHLEEIERKAKELADESTALKSDAIKRIRDIMRTLNIAPEDIAASTRASRRRPRGSTQIAYRSPAGDVWTGRGRRPAWVQEAIRAGIDIEQYRVQE